MFLVLLCVNTFVSANNLLFDVTYSTSRPETLMLIKRAKSALDGNYIDSDKIPKETLGIRLTVKALGRVYTESSKGSKSLEECLKKIFLQLNTENSNLNNFKKNKKWSIVLEWAFEEKIVPTQSTKRFWDSLKPDIHTIGLKKNNEIKLFFPTQWRTWPAEPSKKQLDLIIDQLKNSNESTQELLKSGRIRLSQINTDVAIYDGKDDVFYNSRYTEDPSSLFNFAEKIITHIGMSIWPNDKPLGIRGNYLPIKNLHSPTIAPLSEQAFSAYALSTFAKTRNNSKNDIENKAQVLADRILNDLVKKDPIENEFWENPRAIAFFLLALSHIDSDRQELWEIEKAQAIASLVQAKKLSPFDHALASFALSTANQIDPHQKILSSSKYHFFESWNNTKKSKLVHLLPWIWFAYKNIYPISNSNEINKLFKAMNDGLIDIQENSSHNSISIGGFTFDSNKKSTSQSLRPIAFLLDNNLRFDRQFDISKVNGLLFLKNLRADRITVALSSDQQRTLGGIRSAPWWDKQPTASQSMALICLKLAIDNKIILD